MKFALCEFSPERVDQMATDRSASSWWGWCVGLLLLVYFGFPALWIAPIDRLYAGYPPDHLIVIAMPIWFLMDHIPGYRDWVEWGLALLGIK